MPDQKISTCKVYPLAPSEQKELDQFLKENLETGWICLSKSLMTSPVDEEAQPLYPEIHFYSISSG